MLLHLFMRDIFKQLSIRFHIYHTKYYLKSDKSRCFINIIFIHRIQITYRMFTPIGANGKLLTLNFHIDTGAATSSQNN